MARRRFHHGALLWASMAGGGSPQFRDKMLFRGLDGGSSPTQIIDGTVRIKNLNRTGTPRSAQPGRCYLLDGVADKVTYGDLTATVEHVSVWIKLAAVNQVILTIQNSTATAVSVVAGVLTFGGSLTASNIRIDGNAKTASEAGALLNNLGWHRLDFDLDAIAASNLIIGTDSTAFGNFYYFDLRPYTVTLADAEISAAAAMKPGATDLGKLTDMALHAKCDEGGTYTTSIDASGNGNDGTITAAAIATFQDETGTQNVFSFQNEIGYTDDTGTSGALLPRDESAPTLDTGSGALEFVGACSHAPTLSSACLDLNGTADRVDCGLATGVLDFERTDPFSVSFWMKTPDTNNASIVGRMQSGAPYRGWEVAMATATAGKIRLSIISTNGSNEIKVSTNATYNDDAWHHVVATYDGSSTAAGVTLYVDGVAVASTIEQNTLSATTVHAVNFNFGSRNAGVGTYYNGRLSDVRIYDSEKTAAQVAAIYSGTNDGADMVGHWPFAEGVGDTAHDRSGNQNHGQLSVASEATAWATTQNLTDTLVTDGCTLATRYNSGEYYNKGSRLTIDSVTKLSFAFWYKTNESGSNSFPFSAWTGTGNQKGWHGSVRATGGVQVAYSPDGSTTVSRDSSSTGLNDGKWHHCAGVLDTQAGTLDIYVDGVLDNGTLTGTVSGAMHATTAAFMINGINAGASVSQHLSGLVIQQAVWTSTQIAALYAGTIPSGAWHFRDGNGKDYSGNGVTIAATGTPDRLPVPNNAGPPQTVAPGIWQPGQSIVLSDEANSPYATRIIADGLTDLAVDQGDDDESDIYFERVRLDGTGSDRLLVGLDLTAQEISEAGAYTT